MKLRISLLAVILALICGVFLLTRKDERQKTNAISEDNLWQKLPENTEQEKLIKSCVKELAATDDRSRANAALQLKWIGPSAEPAIPALIRALKSPKLRPNDDIGDFSMQANDIGQEYARDALVAIGKTAVPHLRKALQHADTLTRVLAASALWRIEKKSDEVVSLLFDARADQEAYERDISIRRHAVQALAEIGKTDPDLVLPRLLQEFNVVDRKIPGDGHTDVLYSMGPAAKAAIPVLMKAIRENRNGPPGRYGNASMALRNIGEAAIPALTNALEDEDGQMRESAAFVLRGMKSEAKGAVPALIRLLKDNDDRMRNHAIGGLIGIGPAARAALPDLFRVLETDKSAKNRNDAAYAIEIIVVDATDAKQAEAPLRNALVDNDNQVKGTAERALQKMNAILAK